MGHGSCNKLKFLKPVQPDPDLTRIPNNFFIFIFDIDSSWIEYLFLFYL